MNFHCPTCTRKPHVRAKCRLEAELKAKKDAELRAKAKLERDRLERGQADELAGAMNEFFTALYIENTDQPVPDMTYYSSSFSDLPLSSPDSITVTTEFGVLEETGNVTIISAGGATHPYDVPDEEDFDDEEHDVHDVEGPESYVVMTEDTSLPAGSTSASSDWVTAVALQHQQQQNNWLLHQQVQSMYHGVASPLPPTQTDASAHGNPSNPLNTPLASNTTPPPTQLEAPVVHVQEGDTGDDSDGLDVDGGEEADVDTDDIFDDEEEDADPEIDTEGGVTPTSGGATTY